MVKNSSAKSCGFCRRANRKPSGPRNTRNTRNYRTSPRKIFAYFAYFAVNNSLGENLGRESGIALAVGAYYFFAMTTISLKLPEQLLSRLERESRERRTTKSSVVRECLE